MNCATRGRVTSLTRVRALLTVLLIGSVCHDASAAASFDRCAAAAATQPNAYESYRCYYEVASSSGDWPAASRHLDRLAVAHPEIDWIVFVRAVVTSALSPEAGERLYLEAAGRFEATGNIRGEVLARANLESLFYQAGRVASAAREVERITALAATARDSEVRVRARVVEAEFFIDTGTNLGRAQRVLEQAELELGDSPAYWLRQHVLYGLGSVLLLTGRYDEAIAHYRRLESAAAAQQDLVTVARARLAIVNTLIEKRSEAPGSVNSARLLDDTERALVAAQSAQDPDLELSALRIIGEALMEEQAQRARPYVDSCIDKARRSERSPALSQCLWIRARLLADTDPSGAQRAIDEAIALLQHEEGADDALLAYAWRHAMRIAWSTQSPDDAIATGKQALDAIERLRDLQPGGESRAAAFSAWTQDYYWLSNQILRLARQAEHAAHARSLMDEAFQIAERMRARSLLDQLRAPAPALVDADEAALQRRESLLKSIVAVNRELLQLKKGGDRTALLGKLASLERAEADAREAQSRAHISTQVVSLAEVQQRLAKNEALLSFQVAGSSWLYVVTRDQARVIELPDRQSLTQSLALFKGLMRQPEHLQRAGVALFDRLLKDAIDGLPSGIDRLLVVPDLPLDTFPLSALTTRYEIALVPSATIWHDWRTHPMTADSREVLVLADPRLTSAYGPLPYARDEGREIVERLQGRGTLLIGGEASEAAFKATDLSRYGVVPFAAHAVVDSVNTDRSSILLASGAEQQDGLLQSREISELHLDGQLVVLSSCQSATGTDVRGEGVMGLARSFFASGSRVVIGSLWPIRDDYAAAFFEPFYAALAEGRSVGTAFHSAQRRLIDEGLPMEAWAGFVLMGDADAVPVTRIENVRSRADRWIAIAAFICIACFIALVRRRYATQRAARRAAVLRPARTTHRPLSHSPALSLE